jgi:hypothetical protein
MRWAMLAAVFFLVACGGSGDDADGRLSHDELVERAGAICERHFDVIERLQREAGSGLGAAARTLPRVADEFRELALDLSALVPPEELEARYRDTFRAIEALAGDLDRAAARARAGDAVGMNQVLQQSPHGERIERFFEQNDFERCRPGGSVGS